MRIEEKSLAPTSGGARRWLRFLLGLGFFGIVFLCPPSQEARAQEPEEDDFLPGVIMPRVGVGIEYGGFPVRGEDYSSAFRYQLLLDLWQYQRHLLYMDFDGETSFGVPDESLAFNRLRHQIAILGYRYDLGDYYGGLRFYHRCYNPLRERGRLESDYDRTVADIFYVGLEFIDKAMLVGQKDRGINFEDRLFEFLGRWHVAASLNRVISKESTDQNWLFTGRVRFDILRYCNLIPYLEAGGEVLGMRKLGGYSGSGRRRAFPWREAGFHSVRPVGPHRGVASSVCRTRISGVSQLPLRRRAPGISFGLGSPSPPISPERSCNSFRKYMVWQSTPYSWGATITRGLPVSD